MFSPWPTGNKWALILLLCCMPFSLLSDSLSELPAAWKGKLTPIAEVSLADDEPHVRTVISDIRGEINRLLMATGSSNSRLAEAYGRLAALYQIQNMESAAQTGYRNAMALEPARFRWTYYAAYLEDQSGRLEEAIKLYQKAKQIRSDYPPLELRLGEGLLKLGQLKQAASTLNEIAGNPKLRPLALYHLAQIDLMQRKYRQAEEKLQKVLQLDPKADAVHYPLALALRGLGKDEAARRHIAKRGKHLPQIDDPMIRELENLNQGARRFFIKGLNAGKNRNFPAAAKAFAQGLEIDPQNINARVSYARALFLSNAPDRAEQELESVLKRAPQHALGLFLTAILLEEKGNSGAAVERYLQVLQQDQQHYGAHFCLANRFYLDGNYQQAAAHYGAALAANPEIPPARLHELLAMKKSGISDKKILIRLEKLIANNTGQLLLRYTLVRLLLLSDETGVRNIERAGKLVNELLQESPIPPHIELQAGVAAAAGNFKKAAKLQEEIIPALFWMGDEPERRGKKILDAYRNMRLPKQTWYEEGWVLRPPVTNAKLMFREYPSVVPY